MNPLRFWKIPGASEVASPPGRARSGSDPKMPQTSGSDDIRRTTSGPSRQQKNNKGNGSLTADEKALKTMDQKLYQKITEEIVESGAAVRSP